MCPQAPTFHVQVRTHTISRPRAEWASALLPLVAWHFRLRTFRLKTWCKWPCLKLNFNVWAYGHLDDTTGAEWRHCVFFSVLFQELRCFLQSRNLVEETLGSFGCDWRRFVSLNHSSSPGVKVHVCRYKTLRNIQYKPRLYFQGSFL